MVRLSLLLLGGCLIDKAAYEDALSALTDADGDGVPPAGGDCDDADPSRYPGAEEVFYDGIDADCAGDDDDDADSDGDPSAEHGGADCDDEDASISGLAEEGWSDGGIDNDCDGTIDDPLQLDASSVGSPIAGAEEGDAFGTQVQVIPAGWLTDEPVLLAAAPLGAAGGAVYGWAASALATASEVSDATWTLNAAAAGDYLGFGLGWAGDDDAPLTIVTAEGRNGGRGEVSAWPPESWGSEPALTVSGTVPDAYLGLSVISGHDHDGDGVADLVAAAPLDSTVANIAGSALVLLDPPSYAGVVSAADADLHLTCSYAGAFLTLDAVGDIDDDGLDDLGLTLDLDAADGPGGLLITGLRDPGTYDVESYATAQVIGGPMIFGEAIDADGDGSLDLYGASGGMYRFELPLAGTVMPWVDALETLPFLDSNDTFMSIRTDSPSYVDRTRLVATSTTMQSGAGALLVDTVSWSDDHVANDAPLQVWGHGAGDHLGASVDFIDLDGDALLDLVVGAPDADLGGSGSGAIYRVPAPR